MDWIDPELHMWIMLDMAAHMPVMAGKTERPTTPGLPVSLPIEAKDVDHGLRPGRAGVDSCPDLAGEPGGEAR